MDACNYNLYSLQLNIYRYILESEYDMRISAMYLGVFHPNQETYLHVVIPFLDAEIEKVVNTEMELGRAEAENALLDAQSVPEPRAAT